MRGYDYAQQGAYYLTICTDGRRHWFGRIADGVMHPSPIGELAQQCWDAIPEHMPHVDIGEFVVMPNHVHGIVIIRERATDGVPAVGPRHGVPGMHVEDGVPGMCADDAPNTNTNATNMDARDAHANTGNAINSIPDDPGTRMFGDVADPFADVHARHTRARRDAPIRDPRKPPGIPHGALGQIVASFKSAVTRIAYRDGLLPRGTPVWQNNYWDRIIRDDAEFLRITDYIRDNPKKWNGDRFNG
jgi:REP element-mobilizing transposase RayT